MARMLPANIFDGCPSPGERDIFSTLKNDPNAVGWTVLHSLDLANHVRQVSGEADFVILIPEVGILCVEVKACRSIRRDAEGWYYGKDTAPHVKGPFRQASEAMHSIRNRLLRAKPTYAGVATASVVVFPYLHFDISSNEWHDWQNIDARKISNRGLIESIRHSLMMGRAHLDSKGVLSSNIKRPTVQEVNEITSILRPSFEVLAPRKGVSERLQAQLRAFTSEQYAALDAMEGNARVLFRGPAGTGKTILAIEAARRAVALGQKVLLICFNRQLASWIRSELGFRTEAITVATLHSYAMSVAEMKDEEITPDIDSFWKVDLPQRALAALLTSSDDLSGRFDLLIVDEAQDIATSEYLDMLDYSLKGGLQEGQWRFFADFEKQAIYGPAGALELLTEHSGLFSVFSLRNNCRNPPRIACLAHLLGRLDPDYTRVLRPDNGIEPEVIYFDDDEQQIDLLAKHLGAINEEGFADSSIVILSPKANGSCASRLATESKWQHRLHALDIETNKGMSFSTIHSFKGLEAQVIVLTDLQELGPNDAADIFYTGVTRPLERLLIFMKSTGRSSIVRTLQGYTMEAAHG